MRSLKDGLAHSGFYEGKNISFSYRYADGDYSRLPSIAAEIVKIKPAVIIAGWPSGRAAKSATSTIPTIFMGGGDPIRSGLVMNLAKPEGNLTGITMMASDLDTKRLEILKDLVPSARKIGILIDNNLQDAEFQIASYDRASMESGQPIDIIRILRIDDLNKDIVTQALDRVSALIVSASTLFNTYKIEVFSTINNINKPAMYELREFVQIGRLMSYSPSLNDVFYKGGLYAAQIIKGERIANMPVLQPTIFELCFNNSTAQKLNLDPRPTFMSRVDEFID